MLMFSHVKHTCNRVVDALANEQVGKIISFHAEVYDDKRDRAVWRRCKSLVVDEVRRRDGGHRQ